MDYSEYLQKEMINSDFLKVDFKLQSENQKTIMAVFKYLAFVDIDVILLKLATKSIFVFCRITIQSVKFRALLRKKWKNLELNMQRHLDGSVH